MFKRERSELTQILADLAAKTDKCKMRHCEVGTLLNKLIHGEVQGREEVGEGGELSQIDQAIKPVELLTLPSWLTCISALSSRKLTIAYVYPWQGNQQEQGSKRGGCCGRRSIQSVI